MVHITSLALLASVVIAVPASYLRQQIATQTEAIEIAGGNEAEVGKQLYVTGVRRSDTGENVCAGVLISPTAVLTNVLCAKDSEAIYVSVGTHFRSGGSDGEPIKIKNIVPHPKFDYITMSYDYAILELENPSKISPIEVSFEDDATNAPGVVATTFGWGLTAIDSQKSDVLKKVGLKIWSDTDCKSFTKRPQAICAGGVQGEGTCYGDHGGPLIATKDGKEVLVGVSSWNVECGKAGVPTVASRLSYAKDFIAPYLPKPAC